MEYKISRERMAHMHGVAEYCYLHASDDFYQLNPNEMYLLGLLHDIGYIDGKSHHESYGGELLRIYGFDDWREVVNHATLLNTDKARNKKLLLLIEADLRMGMSDHEIGYDLRLQDIAARHGINSRAYELCRRNVEFLRSIGR